MRERGGERGGGEKVRARNEAERCRQTNSVGVWERYSERESVKAREKEALSHLIVYTCIYLYMLVAVCIQWNHPRDPLPPPLLPPHSFSLILFLLLLFLAPPLLSTVTSMTHL